MCDLKKYKLFFIHNFIYSSKDIINKLSINFETFIVKAKNWKKGLQRLADKKMCLYDLWVFYDAMNEL